MLRRITICLICIAGLLALGTGIAELAGKEELLCSASVSACVKAHSSHFATAFAIPLGFYAAALLAIVLALFVKGKDQIALVALCGVVGFEAYFTFIQVVFIQSVCTSCLMFFILLVASAAAAMKAERIHNTTNPALLGFSMFFVAHFAFFFPALSFNPSITAEPVSASKVEVFASPSCPHCKEAIKELKLICKESITPLVIRPVSISKADMRKTMDWVCEMVFRTKSPTTLALSQKIIWENEDEARELTGGMVTVPIIKIETTEDQAVIKGWNENVRNSVAAMLLPASLSLAEHPLEFLTVQGGKSCGEQATPCDDPPGSRSQL